MSKSKKKKFVEQRDTVKFFMPKQTKVTLVRSLTTKQVIS